MSNNNNRLTKNKADSSGAKKPHGSNARRRRRIHKLPPGLPNQKREHKSATGLFSRRGLVATICICIPIGFVLGRMSAVEPDERQSANIDPPGRLVASVIDSPKAAVPVSVTPEADRLYEVVDLIEPRLFPAITRRIYRISQEQHRQSLLRLVMRRWIVEDQPAALDYATSMTQQPAGLETLKAAVEVYAEIDPLAALQWAEALPDDERKLQLVDAVYDAIASADPVRAIGMLEALPSQSEQKANASMAIMYHWVRRDSGAAFDWLNTIEDEQLRQDLYNTTMYRWVLEYPLEARDVIARMPDVPEKLQLVAQYAFHAAQRDPEDTARWAHGLADQIVRQHALITALDQWVQQDAGGALQYIFDLPQGDERRQLSESIGTTLAARDPLVAAESIYQFEPDLQVFLAERVASGLVESDPGAADQWYSSLTDSDIKRSALYGLIDHYVQVNPEYGFNLALDSDITDRFALMQQTIEALARYDPGAARRVIGSAPLNDDERQLLSVAVNGLVYPTN